MELKLSKLSKWIISIVAFFGLCGIVKIVIENKNKAIEAFLAGLVCLAILVTITFFTNYKGK